ncbi:hypothetical protein C1H46_020393 [Malus baccata]|uniref:Major facilitator superfamily (MFS) profile domain-containing protein n=1 Tax=Malus baccata TaxID=106549 RepID=A0A540M5I8_MALBA|nr:hypothetical protein C1H46_020393 [Malus baccata]
MRALLGIAGVALPCMNNMVARSIGFVGPGIALVGLITAKSPAVASAWLTSAVGLKSFSHSGFLVNLQVGISECYCS